MVVQSAALSMCIVRAHCEKPELEAAVHHVQ